MIIAVDFDGTLCSNDWPRIGAPRKAVIAYIRRRREQGDKLILWTNRRSERLSEAVEWCRGQGVEFDAVNENLPEIVERFGGDCRKVYADMYLDDKAMKPEDVERMEGRGRRTAMRGR